MPATTKYTVATALNEILADKFRGPGSATIVMADGRGYFAVDRYSTLVMRVDRDGQVIETIEAADAAGNVECIRWSCDQLGGIYI